MSTLNNDYTLNVASIFAFVSIIIISFGVNYYLSRLHGYAAGDTLSIPKFLYILVVVAAFALVKNRASRGLDCGSILIEKSKYVNYHSG
ncbi:hypothetical protein [uncultured Croceitalea sp.]|uniref:hypothetical protein n=1 Tax=uncultured Croceitalea sp. TaxID=1798908 RepID=UPI00374F8810